MDSAVHLQLADSDTNRLRNADRQAFNGKRVDRLVQHATGRHAGGRAAQLDRHRQNNALVGSHAREIDV